MQKMIDSKKATMGYHQEKAKLFPQKSVYQLSVVQAYLKSIDLLEKHLASLVPAQSNETSSKGKTAKDEIPF